MTMQSETTGNFSFRRQPAPAHDHYTAESERTYDSFNDLYEDFDDERSKAPFVIVGALLAVAIIGAGLAFAYKQGSQSGTDGPQVIKADTSPVKVVPEQPGGSKIPFQDKAIYNAFNTEGNNQAGQGQLTENSALAGSGAPSQAPLTISALATRFEGNAGTGAPQAPAPLAAPSRGESLLAAPAVPAAPGAPASQTAGLPRPLVPNVSGGTTLSPRRVETVTILPNGTILQAPAQPASGAQAPTSLAPAPTQPVASSPLQLPSLPNVIDVEPVVAQPALPSASSGSSSLVPSPRPKPRPIKRVASAEPSATLRPAARPAPASLAGQYAVQVASHRRQSEALSKFADMQRRYPRLLSSYQPLIQRADLGDRGVFYRLRFGPVASKSKANRLCSDLRSAGVSACIVRPL